MVSRREKASLSEDVDATRSAQFRVIDPPRTSPQPVFPNRLALAPAVLLLALLAGLGGSFLATQLQPTFDNARLLRNSTQRAVLGSVSLVVNAGMLQRARRPHGRPQPPHRATWRSISSDWRRWATSRPIRRARRSPTNSASSSGPC